MSYATTNQWSTRGDHLDDDLVAAGVSVQDLLDESSREMDRYMGRRSLEPKLVTNHDVVVAGNRPSLRHVRIDDHPVHQSEDWFFSLSGAQLFDRTFTAQTAMATSDVTIRVAELSGQLYLPEPAYDGWTLRLSYSCGYGTNVSTPSIPDDLREACLLWCESKVLHWVGQGNPETISIAGVRRSMAQEKLAAWMQPAVA
jgi:hypothetical protein|tara:strand:+ start:2377 stop:2973 length:597 start_codon:yes stop_codon:yes gene_type:complete